MYNLAPSVMTLFLNIQLVKVMGTFEVYTSQHLDEGRCECGATAGTVKN